MRGNAPRQSKRSPTPTSATFPTSSSADSLPPASPSTTTTPGQKPLYLCSPFVEAALVKGNFKTIVMLPKYVDIMEWVAVNGTVAIAFETNGLMPDVSPPVFDFFQNLNMFYGVISECCTQPSCPTMSAGPAYVFYV